MLPINEPIILELRQLREDVNSLLAREFPNQALDTQSSPTFAGLTLSSVATWTPAYAGSGTAGVFTYTIQQGYYVKLAGLCFIFARTLISAIGTPPTGTMSITGLPFAAAATYKNSVTFGRISNFKYTAAALALTGNISAAGVKIDLEESFTNAVSVAVPAANFTNAACDLYFSAAYLI